MGDTLLETEQRADAGGGAEIAARALGILLEEHKGNGVIVMDMRPMNTWTDFFVIAGVTSATHLEGLERHIKEFVSEHELEIIRRSPKPSSPGEEWRIIDMGAIVVHLMSAKSRSFYELERLYSPPLAQVVYAGTSA